MRRPSKRLQRLRERVEIYREAMLNATDRLDRKMQRDKWRAAQLTLENSVR